jgi:D-glycero-beta-D-manno-heptose 1-phosphate adenylyltransferase
MGQVITRPQLEKIVGDLKNNGKTIVTTNGCFDILHIGHVRILNEAKALGDVLIVGLNSDGSVKKLKGPDRPIVGQDDRAELLANLNSVDYVTVFEEDNPIEFLKVAKPSIHVKGQDYKTGELLEAPVVESLGGRVELLKLVPGKSTTNLIGKIQC